MPRRQLLPDCTMTFPRPTIPAGAADLSTKSRGSQTSHDREVDVEVAADRLVLRDHAPVGVVINNALEVVQFRGITTPIWGLRPANRP